MTERRTSSLYVFASYGVYFATTGAAEFACAVTELPRRAVAPLNEPLLALRWGASCLRFPNVAPIQLVLFGWSLTGILRNCTPRAKVVHTRLELILAAQLQWQGRRAVEEAQTIGPGTLLNCLAVLLALQLVEHLTSRCLWVPTLEPPRRRRAVRTACSAHLHEITKHHSYMCWALCSRWHLRSAS